MISLINYNCVLISFYEIFFVFPHCVKVLKKGCYYSFICTWAALVIVPNAGTKGNRDRGLRSMHTLDCIVWKLRNFPHIISQRKFRGITLLPRNYNKSWFQVFLSEGGLLFFPHCGTLWGVHSTLHNASTRSSSVDKWYHSISCTSIR